MPDDARNSGPPPSALETIHLHEGAVDGVLRCLEAGNISMLNFKSIALVFRLYINALRDQAGLQ